MAKVEEGMLLVWPEWKIASGLLSIQLHVRVPTHHPAAGVRKV